jgi:hypothetical protein
VDVDVLHGHLLLALAAAAVEFRVANFIGLRRAL